MPKISIIMGVHNGDHFLMEAVDSILTQSFADFEFIIVDDASDDMTLEILHAYADPRLIILKNEQQLGLAASLNKALQCAKGEYIARMDADDVSQEDRLARQSSFLDAHPEVGLLGSGFYRINEVGKRLGTVARKPLSDIEIRWAALLENPFAHPTMMMRRRILEENGISYDPSYSTTQDYELWTRLLVVSQGANLPEPLLYYRIHAGMVSTVSRNVQQSNSIKIAEGAIKRLLPNYQISTEKISQLQSILFGGSRLRPPRGADRMGLAESYYTMFMAFREVYPNAEKIRAIGQGVAMRLAHLVLLPPMPQGWASIARRAARMDPQFYLKFLTYFSDVMIREVGRRLYLRPNRNKEPSAKILYVIGSLDVGGAEKHLVQILKCLDKNRYVATVYTLSHKGKLAEHLEKIGIEVIAPPPFQWLKRTLPRPLGTVTFLALSAIRLIAIMLVRRPDVVHFFLPTAYIVGGFCSILACTPIRIMSRRSLSDYMKRQPFASWVEKILHNRMTAILSNSGAVRNELLNEKVSEKKVGLLFSGVDLNLYDPDTTLPVARENLGLEPNTLVLVCIANLIGYKGHADLLDAIATVSDRMPPQWALLCAGRDDGIGKFLQNKAKELGLSENIRWLGERHDVPGLLAIADISLLCSHEEGFSNSILESMSMELPVIATAVGGNTDAVVDGETGLLVPVGDAEKIGKAILSLSDAADVRKKMGRAGRARVRRLFSLDRCVLMYETMYSKLLTSSQVPLFLQTAAASTDLSHPSSDGNDRNMD